jgi:ABC-2 type transport system permease protein
VNPSLPLARATWLLIRLRLTRLLNVIAASTQRKPKAGAPAPARTGTAGKSRGGFALAIIVWPGALITFGMIALQAMRNLHFAVHDPMPLGSGEFGLPLVVAMAFLLFMLCFSSFLIAAGARELSSPDWDLEWLVTLPMQTGTLLWSRILERTLVNPTALFSLIPACVVIAWFSGLRWAAVPAGLAMALPLMLLVSVLRTVFDTGLRLTLKPAQLRNLQAVLSICSVVAIYLTVSMGMQHRVDFMLKLAAGSPGWLAFTPFGLVVRVLNERELLEWLTAALLLVAEVFALTWLGIGLLRHQLRSGVVADGARVATQRSAATGVERRGLLSLANPVHWRELKLLSRDRNFLVQSLVLPVVIIGGQFIFNGSRAFDTIWSNGAVLAAMGFGIAAYSLNMSAFQTLNSEGHALWMLYTYPRDIAGVLRDKARLWGVIALVYPAVLFSVGFYMLPSIDTRTVVAVITALVGVPIYAFIAVALGVFACDPLAQHVQHKIKLTYLYLFMSLSGLYVYAILTPQWLQRLVFVVLTLVLAFALWQKARDRLPYLLDPDAAPPPRVSTSDGMIAAMLFFVLQGIVALALTRGKGNLTGAQVLIAFSAAGAVTYLLTRWVYWRARTLDVPRMFGAPLMPSLRTGLIAGAIAVVVALGYLFALSQTSWVETTKRDGESFMDLGWWLLPITVIAAPLCEEFIFRGLIFAGLRRSFGLGVAVLASATLFAIMHPPLGMIPVFVLGVCTALAYERTRTLLAPVIAHAFYNLCVVGLQALAP